MKEEKFLFFYIKLNTIPLTQFAHRQTVLISPFINGGVDMMYNFKR